MSRKRKTELERTFKRCGTVRYVSHAAQREWDRRAPDC
jgi:hypothetical protein